jgi:hypothetical protein
MPGSLQNPRQQPPTSSYTQAGLKKRPVIAVNGRLIAERPLFPGTRSGNLMSSRAVADISNTTTVVSLIPLE